MNGKRTIPLLAGYAGRFAANLATDGRDGDGFLHSYSYDLIVLDLMPPQLSGTDLLRRVRREHAALPVLALVLVLVLTPRGAIDTKWLTSRSAQTIS